ncbi:hemerythrin domain-containing protein [Usitatibacter palustris]|uniref:Hemerythrin-like domain-containing protein n=1 Tax=Usitatibacter palustris TaxID=2732487 RepID=A0A6M4H4R0_9PROT|nr:hemerythrin domain-containing protein [Usitatibacter palustris]QJR14262.1 hypothetical protein DSM104440_01055 [Usitatibacter palustris]
MTSTSCGAGRSGRFVLEGVLEDLDQAHQRIVRNCGLVTHLADKVAKEGVTPEAREYAGTALRFFESAADHHDRDEEQGLFPVLAGLARGEDADRFGDFERRIAGQRPVLEAAWQRVRSMLHGVAAGGFPGPDFSAAARALAEAYSQRIRIEESEAFPVARLVLDAAAAGEIHRDMAYRRAPLSPQRT